jgi:hypothetical protein
MCGVWIAGCPGEPGATGDGGIDAARDVGLDAHASYDAGRDAYVLSDVGIDATRSDATAPDVGIDHSVSPDTGMDAFSAHDAGIDAVSAHDSAPRPDTNADAGLFCPVGGLCTRETGEPGLCCSGACVDLSADDANCGACGNTCGSLRYCRHGRCEHPSCVGVVSSSTSSTVASTCPLPDGSFGTCCDGACRAVSDLHDDANCGACGNLCPPGLACTGIRCAPPASIACDSLTNAPCPAGTICPYGSTCERSSCTGVGDGVVCALSIGRDGVCCAGACVDTGSDPANCGACGTVCPAGTACGGSCITAPPCGTPDRIGQACVLASRRVGSCCGSDCVDTRSDEMNCYECGIACQLGATCRGGELCVDALPDGGVAQLGCAHDGDCPTGHHCLPGVPWNFCWRDVCAGVADGTSCAATGVGAGICCGGTCVSAGRDPNCGACGRTCASGVCAVLGPSGGGIVATCLPDPSAGSDCSGARGCPPGSACVGGVCMTQSCAYFGTFCRTPSGAPGECCGATTCADLASDPMHCGGCYSACPTGQTCARGRCVP